MPASRCRQDITTSVTSDGWQVLRSASPVTCHSLHSKMLGLDLTTMLVIIIALVVLFLAIDCLLAGGGMTSGMMSGMMHGGAAMMGSPYGWILIVALIVVALAIFGLLFR